MLELQWWEINSLAARPLSIMHRSLATTRKQGFLLAKYKSFQVCIACLFLVGSSYTLSYFMIHDKVQKGHQYLQSLNTGNSRTISCYIHAVKCLGYNTSTTYHHKTKHLEVCGNQYLNGLSQILLWKVRKQKVDVCAPSLSPRLHRTGRLESLLPTQWGMCAALLFHRWIKLTNDPGNSTFLGSQFNN